MAAKKENTTIKKMENKDIHELEKEILLTEEEYARKVRQKNKETMNRVLRVVGLLASFILIYAGLFDPIFELSYFGWMSDGVNETAFHTDAWNYIRELSIYDDPMQFGLWLPKLGLTAVLIVAVLGTVYLAVYNIVDIIALIKNVITGTTAITQDLTGTVKDTVADEKELKRVTKKKNKSLFSDTENMFKHDEKKDEKQIKKPAIFQRRKEADASETGGLTEAELDRLLSGESLDEPKLESSNEDGEKDIFKE